MTQEPKTEVLFCPFCRECFEGRTTCPDHDLKLVSFEEIAKKKDGIPREDEPVAFYDVRFGRGLVWLSALTMMIGFALPAVTVAFMSRSLTYTGAEVALHRAQNLWCVPFVAVALIAIVLRRRTPREMRGARLAVPLLSVLGAFSVGYTVFHIQKAIALDPAELVVHFEPGVYTMLVGALIGLLSGIRLGVLPTEKGVPHGASAEGEGAIRFDEEDGS